MEDLVLTNRFIEQDRAERLFALQIAALAAQLAQQAGEEVTRPLTRAQLHRALEVNAQETGLVVPLLWERWNLMHETGSIPAHGYAGRPVAAE